MVKLISHIFGRGYDKIPPALVFVKDPGQDHPMHCKCLAYHS